MKRTLLGLTYTYFFCGFSVSERIRTEAFVTSFTLSCSASFTMSPFIELVCSFW
mgnify:CR=1 FL=1